MEVYKAEVENYQKLLDDLEKNKGQYSESYYLNKKIEYTKDYQTALTNVYNEEKSLHDMYISNLKEQSQALQKLISKRKESLQVDKTERDYKKSISEKTKNIADLEKQIAMLEGNTSEEAMADRQKLQSSLSDAKTDLEDTQYDKYIERLEDGLDDLQSRFDEIIEKLDEQAVIESVNSLITITNDQTEAINKGISEIIGDAGLGKYLGTDSATALGKLNTTAQDLLSANNEQIGTLNETVNIIGTTATNILSNLDNTLTGIYNAKTENEILQLYNKIKERMHQSSKEFPMAGYASGGIVEAVHRNGDDGVASLKVGEGVLTPEQIKDIREFVQYLKPLNNSIEGVSKPIIPNLNKNMGGVFNNVDNINFEFNLPNVMDAESLVKTIQTNTKVQKTLQNATIGKLNSNTRFGVNRL